jgi:hypothetical protein
MLYRNVDVKKTVFAAEATLELNKTLLRDGYQVP